MRKSDLDDNNCGRSRGCIVNMRCTRGENGQTAGLGWYKLTMMASNARVRLSGWESHVCVPADGACLKNTVLL